MKLPADRLRKLVFALALAIAVCSMVYVGLTWYNLNKQDTASTVNPAIKSNTVLQVETDASVHATEQRVYSITEETSCLVWNLSNMKSRSYFTMASVRVTQLDDQGQAQDTIELIKTPFSNLWRASSPSLDFDAYAIDSSWQQLYLLTPFSKGQVMVTIDYSVKEVAVPYRDVSEVLWTVVSGSNAQATTDATLSVVLPTPADTEDASQSVYSWSHGPTSDGPQVSEDGVVTYHVDKVDVWQFAELRIDFPTGWMTNLPSKYASTYSNQLRLENIREYEAEWEDSWHLRSINSYSFDMAFIALCFILLLFALAVYLRHGKLRLPDFTGEYWNKPPYVDQPIHPSSVGQIWRWNRRRIFDLHAGLNYLATKNVISVEPLSNNSNAGYRLTRTGIGEDNLRPIDQATLAFLFEAIAKGSDTLTTYNLRAFKKSRPQEYRDAVNDWYRVLMAEFDESKYFEPRSRRWQTRLLILGVLIIGLGFALYALFSHPVLPFTGTASGLAIILIANYLPRRTPLGNNITARAKALRNWICDDVDEELMVDAPSLSALFPYACLFDRKKDLLRRADAFLTEDQRVDLDNLDDEDLLWRCCYVTALLANEEPKDGK